MKTNTVELIHAAFDDAEDFLLREAEKFEEKTAPTDEETKYAAEMIALGFVISEKVQEIQKKEKELAKSDELVELVKYYKKEYPFLKFLTVIQLDTICEKYDLIHAPVQNYKMHVPKKNLKEISGAQELKIMDLVEDTSTITRSGGFLETRSMQTGGLFIAAPESHFDLKGLTKKGVRGFFQEIVKKEVDDPIVFRYVRGGIQVLSKWGLEANDPLLANPLDN